MTGARTIPTIGLSFLFRDDILTIEAMLDSVLPIVDQVIAVDTGAKDGTRRVVKKALKEWAAIGGGNRSFEIVDFEWTDDFAAARQAGWNRLTTDWSLWCDADDIIDGAPALRQIAAEAPDNIHAFIFDYDYAQGPDGVCVCTLRRERLLRSPQQWHWQSPVHEVCVAKFHGANFALTNMPVWRHRKQPRPDQSERNLRIIEKHIADAAAQGVTPDPRMAIYHGVELAGRGRHEEALAAYDRYFEISGWGEEMHQGYHRKADSLRALGRFDEAMACDSYALTHAQDHGVLEWADHHFGIGESLIGKQQHASALKWFERGLEIGMPQSSLILNPRDYDWMPLVNLATCHAAIGEFDTALAKGQEAWLIMQDENLGARIRAWAQMRQRAVAVNSTLGLLESLIRYDENAKARKVLRELPYVVRDDPRVQEMARHIRSSLRHVADREEYAELYATNREVRNPDDLVQNASEILTRVKMLKEALIEQGAELERVPHLLDAGCNDGWVAAHCEKVLGLCQADGVDLNHEAILAAKERAEKMGLVGRYEEGFVEDSAALFGNEVFDTIALFEVYEHLVDPHDSLDRLEQALRPGGRVLISTPIGAYEGGLVENWSENWKKQHLRAVTPNEFCRFALQRGNLHAMELGAENVQVVSYTPQRKKGHIVFYAGQGWEPWSPFDLKQRGLGGSETAITQMATHFARMGWFVEVFGGLSTQGPIEQVLWRPHFEYDPDDPCDVFVAVRVPEIIDQQPKAFHRVFWAHDCHYGGGLKDRAEHYDTIFCLSESHADSIAEREGVPRETITVTRNGIDLERWQNATDGFDLREPTVIYSSSPDRGLDKLLEMWPQIKAAVPLARLKVFYGFDVFDRMHSQNPGLQAWKRMMLAKMEALDGVEFIGRTNQDQLALEQQAARVWAYPYSGGGTETSCITAMEAMAAGMVAVTTDQDALPETLGRPGEPTCPGMLVKLGDDFEDRFATCVIDALTDEVFWGGCHALGLARAQMFSWKSLAEEWEQILGKGILTDEPAILGAPGKG
jgi:glycosyltransferase involved in cell wall biosynthesis/tetratricopeptide (TPR) repeat protein